jgi:hypothetical protein
MRRKKSRAAKKIPIKFGDIEYVGRHKNELMPELNRVQSEIRQVLRLLNYLKRKRNHVLAMARFQLMESLRTVPDDSTPDFIADEIARLSYVMSNTLDIINQLRNSRTPMLEEIRFKLTYGQTPRKREIPPGSPDGFGDEEESYDKEARDDGSDTSG